MNRVQITFPFCYPPKPEVSGKRLEWKHLIIELLNLIKTFRSKYLINKSSQLNVNFPKRNLRCL